MSIPEHAVLMSHVNFLAPCFCSQRYFDQDRVYFLGEEGTIAQAGDWNNPSMSKLWLYNLHYFDDLNAVNATSRVKAHHRLIHRWIAENPAGMGNGWEPYPISLRLVNWIRWWNREGINDELIARSIDQQTDALIKQLEYNILGNHLFANAKALFFAGIFLKGARADKAYSLGLKILRREIPEQFLADGGHFELSPMYHSTMLWDLLDLINLAQISKKQELTADIDLWKDVATKAFKWLQVLTHPDGEISFFNDSAFGIAPKPEKIIAYGKQLGIVIPEAKSQVFVNLKESGYSRINMPGHVAIVDHAAVGPDYLPGHAHADSLSLEWSVGKQRVLVNSGTSIYGVSQERLRQRQTGAHNTVVVDGKDSSEVWGGFRVARRAYSKLTKVDEKATKVVLSIEHDGYSRSPGNVIHQREIKATETDLQITDHVLGHFKQAEALLHLHPDIKVNPLDEQHLIMLLPSGEEVAITSDTPIAIADSTWHPQFGMTVPNKRLSVVFRTNKSLITFSLTAGSRA
jgi:uncharacterized heparinase superfamily protein